MAGYKEFLSGEVLNAEDLNDYLMDQVTLVFDSALARDNALSGYLTEGMKSYLKQNNQTYYYDGSAWQLDGPAFLTGYPQGTSITAPEYSGRVLMTTGTSSVPVWQAYPSHNYIINGAFDVWQRGTSVALGNGVFAADRWIGANSGAVGTMSRQSFTPGQTDVPGNPIYFLRWDTTTGDNFNRIMQRVEDVNTLAGQTVTYSFYAKGTNPGAGSYVLNCYQNFGSGGSTELDTGVGTVVLTSSWQRFSYTFTVPSVSGKTIGAGSFLAIDFRQASTDTSTTAYTMDLANVQLEAGSVATPFRRNANSLQGELAACQRYYVRYSAAAANYYIAGRGNASSTTAVVMQYPTLNEMRVTPTSLDYSNIAVYDEVTAPAVTAATLSSLANSKLLQATLTSSGLTQYRGYTTVSQGGSAGYIGFSAEL